MSALQAYSPGAPTTYLHFQKVAERVDVAAILEETRANRALWYINQQCQALRVHEETNSIYLRKGVRRNPSVPLEDCHQSVQTDEWARFPRTTKFLIDFSIRERAELSRAMLVRLKPQGRILPHCHDGAYYARRDRYHLVIQSPGGSDMRCDDEQATFHRGDVFCFNNKVMHQAFNAAPDWRIHLIFDLLPLGRSQRFPPAPHKPIEPSISVLHRGST